MSRAKAANFCLLCQTQPVATEVTSAGNRVRARILAAAGTASRRLPRSTYKNRLGRLAAYLMGDPSAVQATFGGLRMWLRPADRTTSSAFWSGTYDDAITDVLAALLRRGGTVVDAGANVGLIGLRLAARVRVLGTGHVLLVEPVPANVKLLAASIEANGLDAFCTVFNVGLADATGSATLLVEGRRMRSGNAGLVPPPGHRRRLTETPIALRTLDDLVRDAGDPTIDIIKLDVEGSELAVLRGAMATIQRDRPIVFGEFYSVLMAHQGATFVDVMKLLAPLGYRAFAIVRRRHLVEVLAEPGRGDVLLATPEHLKTAIQTADGDWLVTALDAENVAD